MPLSLVVSLTPSIIHFGKKKGLVAKVRGRSSHVDPTPVVGGIPIMIGILFCSLVLMPPGMWGSIQYILAALLIVFMVGLRDDIEEITPKIKVIGQAIAILALITKGDVMLHSFYGLFGQTWELPYLVSAVISGFTLLVISNAFNLIDGINGLAGTVGTIICSAFGVWFYTVGEIQLGVLSMVTAGSLLGFLMFNMAPAKTFMGDSGSLVVGLMIGVLAIKFIDISSTAEMLPRYQFNNPVAVCIAILIVPLFDTIRVFTTRIVRGVSPFMPDRRHIHHLVIDSGFNHLEGTTIIGLFNLLIISLVFYLDNVLGQHYLIALVLGIALSVTFFLHRNVRQVKSQRRGNLRLEGEA